MSISPKPSDSKPVPMLFSVEQERAWQALSIGPLYDWREASNPEHEKMLPPIVVSADTKPIDQLERVVDQTPGPVEVSPSAQGSQALGDLNWIELRQRVSTCNGCVLSQSRTQTVFAAGQPGAQLAIVGEAPGEEEDLSGEPFVGRAGQLLNNMLKAIGLKRESDVIIFNSLKCRPPANRNPSVQELQACLPFLNRQLEIARPKVILLTGKFAVQAILKKDESIASLRNQPFAYTFTDGTQAAVLVTYHPAYYLRRLTEKAKGWEDFLALKKLLK